MDIGKLKKYQGEDVEIIREVVIDRGDEIKDVIDGEVMDEEEIEEETIRGFVEDVSEDYGEVVLVKHITMDAEDIKEIRKLNEEEL